MRPRTQKILWALYPWVAFSFGVLVIETGPPLTDANRGLVAFVLAAGTMIFAFLSYLKLGQIEREERRTQIKDWIDQRPFFRTDMPMYYAEEKRKEEVREE